MKNAWFSKIATATAVLMVCALALSWTNFVTVIKTVALAYTAVIQRRRARLKSASGAGAMEIKDV